MPDRTGDLPFLMGRSFGGVEGDSRLFCWRSSICSLIICTRDILEPGEGICPGAWGLYWGCGGRIWKALPRAGFSSSSRTGGGGISIAPLALRCGVVGERGDRGESGERPADEMDLASFVDMWLLIEEP